MPEAVLEFKAKDGAWYAGTAEFEGPFLRVHFEHFPVEDDERWLPQRFKTPQDVKKMIRPASQPMQDSQCSGLRRGMFLCVACRRPGTICFEYYDAKLQQFHRSSHKSLGDGQECCICKFEVEWLGGPFLHKRQLVVCGDICLRTPGDIEDDPVIKDYIAEVKSLKVSKSLSSIDMSEKDASLLSKKRKMALSDDERKQQPSKGDDKEHATSEIDQQGCNTSLEPGEGSKQVADNHTACTDEPLLKKVHLNTPSGISASKAYVEVIQIDSDKEEEPVSLKYAVPVKITEAFSNSAMNEGKKLNDDEMVNDDQKSQATSAIAKLPVDGDQKSQVTSPIVKPLIDEFSAHEFSELSKEHSFSCGNGGACSCLALQKHCFKSNSCECEAVGFIPISSCHLTNMCSGHRRCKSSSRRTGKSGHACNYTATSQVCDKVDLSQAGNAIHSQVCEAGGDAKESTKGNKWEYSCEGAKGLCHYLLVENLEKDILPSKAMKAVCKVSSGAITVYIWPCLDYETTKRGYIFYKDSKAAEAAYLNFSAGKFMVTSSKGRPWIIRCRKSEWIAPCNINAAGILKEENKEVGKEGVDDKELLIIYKGTEEYTRAVGRQKLFMVQQEKLRCCYKTFANEERDLEAFM